MDYVKKKELAGEINQSEKGCRSFTECLRNKECVFLAHTHTPPQQIKTETGAEKALKCKEMETKSCAGTAAGAETLCPVGSYRRSVLLGVTCCAEGEGYCYGPWWAGGDTKHRRCGSSRWLRIWSPLFSVL